MKQKMKHGLAALDELNFDVMRNKLTEDSSNEIFNIITNNEYDKKLEQNKLDKFIQDEITYILSKYNNNYFFLLWETVVNKLFATDYLDQVLTKIGIDKEGEFIDYAVKKFNRKTINEWMRYYEFIDKTEQHERLKSKLTS